MNVEVERQTEELRCTVISPTDKLLQLKTRDETTRASALLMHTKKCIIDKAHFVASEPPTKVTRDIKLRLEADLKRVSATGLYHGRIYKAMSEVLLNKNRLEKKSAKNEAEIRYAVCDPLISMVCDCFNYALKLEETVKDNLEEGEEVEDVREEAVLVDLRRLWSTVPLHSLPPTSTSVEPPMETPMDLGSGRRSIGGAMSQASKADYAIYTLAGGGRTKVVAIVDAKKHITPHSTAQVIGYYSAFEIGDPRPLVLIMTEDELKIIIFPFKVGLCKCN